MRKLFLACIILISSTTHVRAVSVSILSTPSSIGEDRFVITVKTEGASAGTNYLRADLYSEGSKNYFGETDNGQSWYGGADGKQYFPITIVSNAPTIATISARLGETSLSDYPGPGNYKLRIRRYTSSGNQGSEDSQPVDIAITKTWPSPSPSPTATPMPSPTPIPTPTPTPQPTADPPRTETPKPSIKTNLSPVPTPQISPSPIGEVAGEMTEIDLSGFGLASPEPSGGGGSPSPTNKPTLNHSRAKTVSYIGVGLLLTSLAGFFLYRRIMDK